MSPCSARIRVSGLPFLMFMLLTVTDAAPTTAVANVSAEPAGHTGKSHQVELSLRIRVEKSSRFLEIFVKNSSPNAIEITSEGFRPEWAVCQWFQWKVDGREAEYVAESVALIPKAKESWRIPPGGVVLWDEISLRVLSYRTKSGFQPAIDNRRSHTVTVLASARWKDFKVSSGVVEVK
jgi:hypothetical protein